MLLALIFLPVALVVITIGLPILILIASMGVMGIVVYNQICTKLSGFTVSTVSTNQSLSSVSSLRIVLPPLMSRTTYRYHDDQDYYSRSSSPPPSPAMMRMEYQMSSSSLSPLQFRYKSNMEAPPSPTSSMHEINLDGRNSQLSRRRRVRFA